MEQQDDDDIDAYVIPINTAHPGFSDLRESGTAEASAARIDERIRRQMRASLFQVSQTIARSSWPLITPLDEEVSRLLSVYYTPHRHPAYRHAKRAFQRAQGRFRLVTFCRTNVTDLSVMRTLDPVRMHALQLITDELEEKGWSARLSLLRHTKDPTSKAPFSLTLSFSPHDMSSLS